MTRSSIALTGALAVLLTACGGTTNNRAATVPNSVSTLATLTATAAPTPPKTTPAGPTPMGQPAKSAVSAIPAVTPSGTRSSSQAEAPTRAAISGLPSETEVAAALLKLSDMPTGWTTSTSNSSDSTGGTGCSKATSGIPDSKATVDYQESAFGPLITETLAVFGPGDASKWMNWLKQQMTCSQIIDTSSGTPTTYQISRMSFPKLGDATLAFRMTGPGGIIGDIEVDAVFVRSGRCAFSLGNLASGPVDSTLTQSSAEAAIKDAKSLCQ